MYNVKSLDDLLLCDTANHFFTCVHYISQVMMDEQELKHDCMGCLSKIWTAKFMIGSFIMGTCETLHLKIIVYNSFAWCAHFINRLLRFELQPDS